MSQLTAKIEAFADLLPDWDSYGAAEISDTAIRKAVAVVEYLDDMALDECINVGAFPVCTGIVQLDIDCHATGRGVEVDCDEEGNTTISYFEKDNEMMESLRENVHCDKIERFLLNQ